MEKLQNLIDSIECCPDGCGLLKENKDKKIPFVKIKPKPLESKK